MRALLLTALGFWVTSGVSASTLFDGTANDGSSLALPRAPQAPLPRLAARAPEPIPADLAAAGARLGNPAMIARLPARQAAEPFSFGVIGDAEPGRFPWERIFEPGRDVFARQLRSLQRRGPDFILQLGDFVSIGTAANYRAHVSLLDAVLSLPLLRCIGNHDRSRPNGSADKALYDAVFGPRDYYFDHGGWRFVSLDSSDRKVTAAQLSWLRDVLSVPGPKVVFTHVPPAYLRKEPSLAQDGFAETSAGAGKSEGFLHDFLTNYFEEGAAEFDDIVSRSQVKAVYMGHIHAFWAGDHRGVRYVISGGGGSPLYPLPPGYPQQRFAHVLWVTADQGALRETVLPLGGAAFTLPSPAQG